MTPPAKLATGLILTAIAGFVDALAFIELGGYFASFMSGNTTQLGLAISGPDGRAQLMQRGLSLVMPLMLIGLFFCGAFVASYISAHEKKWYSKRVMWLIIGLLLSVVILSQWQELRQLPVMLLAAAMGAQNAVFKQAGAARLGTTYVTGTVFNAANDLANGLHGKVPRQRWLQHVAVWLALVCGVALGALLYSFIGIWSILLPVATLLALLTAFRSGKFWLIS